MSNVAMAGSHTWAREDTEPDTAQHFQCNYDLRSHLNALSPVSAFPAEVLSEVFLHAAEFYTTDITSWPWMDEWIQVTHVCRRWRAVALGCSALWSRLTLTGPCDWMSEFIARSKTYPLSVSVLLPPPRTSSFDDPPPPLEDSLDLAFPCLTRIRTLALEVEPESECSSEIMELLDGPAPLLEFLSISEEPRFDSGSAVIGPLSELLRRPESSGLRHLELNCPVDWTGVSLPRLTLLSVGNCRDKTGMEAFLNALAQMPLLEELITQYAFIDYRGEPAASPLVPRAVLSRLRVLRLRETAANCTCILESLDTPSLSRLCVNSVERGSALWQAHLCAAAASKMDILGQIGTLAVSGNRANFPYDIFLRCYHDVPNTPATDAEEDSTHDWLNDRTPFLELNTNHCIDQEDLAAAAFCQLLSIQSLRCLVFHKKLPSQTLWRHLIKHTQFVAELRVFDIEDARDLPAMLVRRRCGDLQGYEDHQYALPRLLCLTLDEVSFRGPVENNPFLTLVRRHYGMGTKHPPFISTLLDCLIERYENGAEIETLRLLEPHDIKENRDVEDLKHVVRYVEWSNSWTPLTWEHDGFDGELPSSCIFSTAIIPW